MLGQVGDTHPMAHCFKALGSRSSKEQLSCLQKAAWGRKRTPRVQALCRMQRSLNREKQVGQLMRVRSVKMKSSFPWGLLPQRIGSVKVEARLGAKLG